jgi:hypothetical protein
MKKKEEKESKIWEGGELYIEIVSGPSANCGYATPPSVLPHCTHCDQSCSTRPTQLFSNQSKAGRAPTKFLDHHTNWKRFNHESALSTTNFTAAFAVTTAKMKLNKGNKNFQ